MGLSPPGEGDRAIRESGFDPSDRFGYASNAVGFGWTNAAILELLALRGELP